MAQPVVAQKTARKRNTKWSFALGMDLAQEAAKGKANQFWYKDPQTQRSKKLALSSIFAKMAEPEWRNWNGYDAILSVRGGERPIRLFATAAGWQSAFLEELKSHANEVSWLNELAADLGFTRSASGAPLQPGEDAVFINALNAGGRLLAYAYGADGKPINQEPWDQRVNGFRSRRAESKEDVTAKSEVAAIMNQTLRLKGKISKGGREAKVPGGPEKAPGRGKDILTRVLLILQDPRYSELWFDFSETVFESGKHVPKQKGGIQGVQNKTPPHNRSAMEADASYFKIPGFPIAVKSDRMGKYRLAIQDMIRIASADASYAQVVPYLRAIDASLPATAAVGLIAPVASVAQAAPAAAVAVRQQSPLQQPFGRPAGFQSPLAQAGFSPSSYPFQQPQAAQPGLGLGGLQQPQQQQQLQLPVAPAGGLSLPQVPGSPSLVSQFGGSPRMGTPAAM